MILGLLPGNSDYLGGRMPILIRALSGKVVLVSVLDEAVVYRSDNGSRIQGR